MEESDVYETKKKFRKRDLLLSFYKMYSKYTLQFLIRPPLHI